MTQTYSVAEAKNKLTHILRDIESGQTVEITRRGKPVGVLLSIREFDKLQGKKPSLWQAIQDFRNDPDFEGVDEDWLEGVRDQSPGREPPF